MSQDITTKYVSVAAIFVDAKGPYMKRAGVDSWTEARDAMKYPGEPPYRGVPVVAHPPCERWGKFVKKHGMVAQDGGKFEHSLKCVRTWGGVLEHPEGSLAWLLFGLPMPPARGWSKPDDHKGRSCLVYQGHYGHRAPKPTWLYAVGIDFDRPIAWGPTPVRDLSHLPEAQRKRAIKTGICQRLSKLQRRLTPEPFAALLIGLAESARG